MTTPAFLVERVAHVVAEEMESALYRGHGQRVRSKQFKKILKKKHQGKYLNDKELALLFHHASASRQRAA